LQHNWTRWSGFAGGSLNLYLRALSCVLSEKMEDEMEKMLESLRGTSAYVSRRYGSGYPIGDYGYRSLNLDAPRAAAAARKADEDIKPFLDMLFNMTPEQRAQFYGGTSAPAPAPCNDTGGTGAYPEHYDSERGPPPFSSPNNDFKAKANAVAFGRLLQLGTIFTRLTNATARCVDCSGPAGVFDTCRVVFGDLLCFNCDFLRHCLSPCARRRFAVKVLGEIRDGTSTESITCRGILVELSPNELVKQSETMHIVRGGKAYVVRFSPYGVFVFFQCRRA